MNWVLPELKGPVTTILTACIGYFLRRAYSKRMRAMSRVTTLTCCLGSGVGTGRIYTITYRATDGCGNFATQSVTVTVPKSKGG